MLWFEPIRWWPRPSPLLGSGTDALPITGLELLLNAPTKPPIAAEGGTLALGIDGSCESNTLIVLARTGAWTPLGGLSVSPPSNETGDSIGFVNRGDAAADRPAATGILSDGDASRATEEWIGEGEEVNVVSLSLLLSGQGTDADAPPSDRCSAAAAAVAPPSSP